MANVIGYARVSTTGQAVEGVSLEAQEARIRAWAAAMGHEVIAMHVDAGLSGKRADNRPALQAAISQARKVKGLLVVYSLSRLARNVVDAHQIAQSLDKAKASLVLLTEAVDMSTAAGRMFFGMLAALGQFERELTAERTAAALAHKRSQGLRVSGQAPFGFRFDGNAVVEDEPERRVLEQIKGLRASGLSFRELTRKLNADGVPARGERWHLASVQRALQA